MKKKKIMIPIILTIVSIVYTLFVKVVDVKKIGPNDSSVGFGSLNESFKNLVGSNETIYKLSEILGYLVLGLVLVYGIIGLRQLIKGKSLKKVDSKLLILGGLYVGMLVVYVFFEKCIVNYRPILMDGELEASYPSSHTMLALCVGISSIIMNRKYIKEEYRGKVNIIILILTLSVLLLRTISGVHWISDILGGVIISATLLSWFNMLYYKEDE